jgi:hypothetical protein
LNNSDGRSDQTQDEQFDNDATFSAIAEAMSSGNQAEVDRLMAAKPGEEEENEQADGQSSNTQLDDKDQTEGQTEVDKEAAAKAASDSDKSVKTDTDEITALKAELFRLKSEFGRIGHLQRTVQELQRQTRPNAAETSKTQVDNPQSKTKAIPEDLQKRITALKEIDPELAETFEVFAKTTVQQTEQEANAVRKEFEDHQRDAEEARFWHTQKQELYKLVPRCDDVFSMPEWQEWKATLTPGQKGMAESMYAQDVATAINAFANHMVQKQGGHQSQTQTAAGGGDSANTQVSTDDGKSDAVNNARSRKVAGAAEVKSSAAKKDAALDEDAYFREMYNKIGKENHILAK